MRRAPRKGATATYVLSVISRIDWIIRQCKTLILRAQCLSNARGSCSGGDGVKLCDSKCSSIMLVESGGEIAVYRRSRNPIVVKVTGGNVEISMSDRRLVISGSLLRVEIETGDGSKIEKTIRLDDMDDLYNNDYLVKHSLKGLENRLNIMLRNLANCARATATPCP